MSSDVRVSLEPIYKDEDGNVFPKVRDILPDLTHVYESPHNDPALLRRNLRKIQAERGGLENVTVESLRDNKTEPTKSPYSADAGDLPEADSEASSKLFTTDDLAAMRAKITEMLLLAGNEAAGSINLIEMLLTGPEPAWQPVRDQFTPGTLTTTTVAPNSSALPVALPSVRSLNAQVIIGTKDRSLRQASKIFQSAAERISATVNRGVDYWESAVQLRTSNWPLVTAPLKSGNTFSSASPDVYAKDFRIAYGLENAPFQIRRAALAAISETKRSTDGAPHIALQGPSKSLRIGLRSSSLSGHHTIGYMSVDSPIGATSSSLDEELLRAQRASLDGELYEEILKEASSFPSAAARVTEKRILVDASSDLRLEFEMMDDIDRQDPGTSQSYLKKLNSLLATLIYHAITALLLRAHRARSRVQAPTIEPALNRQFHPPKSQPILGPIISLLQYYSFVSDLHRTLSSIRDELRAAGISCHLDIKPIGDDIADVLTRSDLLMVPDGEITNALRTSINAKVPNIEASANAFFSEREDLLRVKGEATMSILERFSMRFTFSSPASLSLHLPQATINIHDKSQLNHLLIAGVGRCVLGRLKDIAGDVEKERQSAGGTAPTSGAHWVVDPLESTLVGDSSGGRIQIKVLINPSSPLKAIAVKTPLQGPARSEASVFHYPPGDQHGDSQSLEDWMREVI